ncbi:DUF2029 domain-containing protein [Alloacidobacterium dinghuense]|uniref:DUF2029 domain-containing protein n=1 Tax=Alloacidobacterium dinghuense TaxID=2763107 RepID=A0A7G8BFQ7_9BACT|nr:glycosyltransferase family 87 protein [Alloacidobacterium dinghuense]QNI31377.1 DUF2029 domain-containing protein [Alloacidobacterium dinghuense]
MASASRSSDIWVADSFEVRVEEIPASGNMRRKFTFSPIWCFLLSIPGILLLFAHPLPSLGYVADFTGFLVGAKLIGTPQIYDIATNLTLQKAFTEVNDPTIIFMRQPFWAYAMKPFLNLTYSHAFLLWRVIVGFTLIACVWVSGSDRRFYLLALSWSVPAMGCIVMGNDSSLILLFTLISLACWRNDRHFLAGVALGLCLCKFHFLIFLPLLLFRKQYRQELKGFLLSAAVLVAINFAVQPGWISLYWGALNIPQKNMSGHPTLMPNFYAAFFWTEHPEIAVVLGGLFVLSIIWYICNRLPFDLAMPLCIFSALLTAPHTNALDWILAMPAILAVHSWFPQIKPMALFLLSPVAALFCFWGPRTIGPAIVVAASLLFLGVTCRLIRSEMIEIS